MVFSTFLNFPTHLRIFSTKAYEEALHRKLDQDIKALKRKHLPLKRPQLKKRVFPGNQDGAGDPSLVKKSLSEEDVKVATKISKIIQQGQGMMIIFGARTDRLSQHIQTTIFFSRIFFVLHLELKVKIGIGGTRGYRETKWIPLISNNSVFVCMCFPSLKVSWTKWLKVRGIAKRRQREGKRRR